MLNEIRVRKVYLNKSAMCSGNEYMVTIRYNKKSCRFHFHDNYLNKSNKADFVWSMLLDAQAFEENPNINDFFNCYGYKDIEKGIEAYNGCKKMYTKLHRLFNDDEISKMWEELEVLGY